MTGKPQRLSREELYDLVWSEPLRILAPRFGVSDVALAKSCRKMSVPLPGRGYWAKRTAGQDVLRVPLPELPPNSEEATASIVIDPEVTKLQPPPPVVPEVSSYRGSAIEAQKEFEADPKNRVAVLGTLREPHKLVAQTADSLSAEARRDPNDWRFKAGPRLDISVTKGALGRGLRVMDAVLKAFHRRGWKAVVAPDRQETAAFKSYVTVLHQQVFFGLKEIMQPARQSAPPDQTTGRAGRRAVAQEGRGRLAFLIYEPWTRTPRFEVVEEVPGDIGDRLNEVMVKVVESAYRDAETIAYQMDEWLEQEKQAELRRLEQQRVEDEASRCRALVEQTRRWAESEAMRSYVAAVRKAVEDTAMVKTPSAELLAWLDWANEFALSRSPLSRPLDELPADRFDQPQAPAHQHSVSLPKPSTPYWYFTRRP